jgi:anti-anti-sigma regulatory factor
MAPTLSLPEELTIYTVGELRPQWLAWLAGLEATEVAVDGAAVGQIDAAGVQLLVALSRSLAAVHRTLQFVNASEVLTSACEALGLPAPQSMAEANGDAT